MCVQLLSHSYLTLCLLQGKHCSKCFMCIISHNNPKYFSCINSFNSPNNLRSRHDYYVPFYTYAQDPGASKWCGQDLNPGSLALEPVLWNAKPPNTQSDGDNPFLKNAKFLPFDPAIPLLGIHTKKTRVERGTCTSVFITALFTIVRTWKQPRCPSADEWIRKLWYIYTMEYYSAIKNTFESVLMRWVKLEPIIQTEVSH